MAFLSILEVEGFSSFFLTPSRIRKSTNRNVHLRQRKTCSFQLLSSAATNLGWEGKNQTVSFSNNTNMSADDDDLSNSEPTSDDDDDASPKKSGYDLGLGKNQPIGSSSTNLGEDADDDLSKSELTSDDDDDDDASSKNSGYDLGLGKNQPLGSSSVNLDLDDKLHWYAPEPIKKPPTKVPSRPTTSDVVARRSRKGRTTRKMVARRQEDQVLRGALWHEEHFDENPMGHSKHSVAEEAKTTTSGGGDEDADSMRTTSYEEDELGLKRPALFYPNIDLSIPESIYSNSTDVVWDLMRWEAYQEAQREPLLVSFLYSSILNHDSLESSLAFLLANKMSSPAMISTQVQSLVKEALHLQPSVGRAIRADIMAVRDRDPACTCLPDVFLYFKGFQALQTYRVANILWAKKGKTVLAHYLQSQMSQTFQIDIHPNATLGSGIMLDHGTGIVIGETARVGHNCSILHHVTLGGSGKKGVDRHPKIGQGVLLGAGASVIGNINIGEGCQIGAGTLVISDLRAHSVAVGVPAKIIGSFVDVTEQPSNVMNQMMDTGFTSNLFESEGI